MISLLFAVSLTCAEVKDIVVNIRANDFLSEEVKEEIVAEMFAVAPPGCNDLQTELGR